MTQNATTIQNKQKTGRREQDLLHKGGAVRRLLRRPEIGSFTVMILVILAIGIASGGNAFNPLGLKNNIAVIAQFGIIAITASLLIIAGEFDLSIGSMIGFAGMSMAVILKWGLPFGFGAASPATAFFCHTGAWLADRCHSCQIRPFQFYCHFGVFVFLARDNRGGLSCD